MAYSFNEIIKLKKSQLDGVMAQGSAPTLATLAGYEFRGYNQNAITEISRTRKFKKGFVGNPLFGRLWGYNVPVKQGSVADEWVTTGDPYYFFGVVPATAHASPKYKNSTVVDYSLVKSYSILSPVQWTIDYLVHPDPQNTDLILGKSYASNALFTTYLGYFVLERHSPAGAAGANFYFADHEVKTLTSFAESYFDGCNLRLTPREIALNIDKLISQVASNRRDSMKLVLNVIEHVLPMLTGYKQFSTLSVSKRREFLNTVLGNGRKGPVGDLLRDLSRIKILMAAGYYSDDRVHADIGFVPVESRPRIPASSRRPLGAPRVTIHAPAGDTLSADLCVVGSGAAGAVIAALASQVGRSVVLIEEGPYIAADQITHDEGAMTARFYKEGGLQTSVDFDMTVLQGKCLGGTTVINNAICFRIDDKALNPGANANLLEKWNQLGAAIEKGKLSESYARVEAQITPTRVSPGIALKNADILLRGFNALKAADAEVARYNGGLFELNLNECLGCGYCNFGCPYERKLSMLETYLPIASQAGAKIISDCHAKKIEFSNGRVEALHCKLKDGRTLRINPRRLVISCGAIGSSMMLSKSGITANVGKGLSFNAATPIFARFTEIINGFDGVQMGSFVDCDDYMLESLFNPPMAFAMTLPGWFQTHFSRMKDYARMACAGVLIGTDNNSSVKRWSSSPDLTGPIELKLSSLDMDKLRAGLTMMARVYFAAGAEEVIPPMFQEATLKRADFGATPDPLRIRQFFDQRITSSDDLILSSSHPQGGNPMSDDSTKGAVDSGFKVHGFDNLYVCDASVFPTTIKVNPQLTVMAMADYAWHQSIGK